MSQMTPQEIVHELDKHIIGQNSAKRAVAAKSAAHIRQGRISCAIAGSPALILCTFVLSRDHRSYDTPAFPKSPCSRRD